MTEPAQRAAPHTHRRPEPGAAGQRPVTRAVAGAALAVTLLPLAVAAVRALWVGWYPAGDNAFFALRARDVLTANHPLLGTWSSASLTAGQEVNNPGPVFFYLLALPARIHAAGGLVVGMVLLHAGAVVLAAAFAWRRGSAAAAVALAMFAALFWAMGSELLIEPWQPHALLPSFLCFLVLAWALGCGDAFALPFAAGVGSLLVQTHLTYGPLVLGLGLAGLVGLWHQRRDVGPPVPTRVAVSTLALAALLWAPPLVEQATSGRDGNLWRIAQSVGDEGTAAGGRVGIGTSARIVASVTAVPPWWGRPSFDQALDPGDTDPQQPDELPNVPGVPAAAAGLAVLATLLGAAAWRSQARGEGEGTRLAGMAGAALLVGTLTAAAVPIGPLGFAAHQVRWLWPIGVFVTGVILLGLLGRRRALPVALVALAACSLLALPTHRQGTGPVTEVAAMRSLRALVGQLDVLDQPGTLLVDLEGLRLFEPYSTPLMLELQRRGIDFVVEHEPSARQLGDRRRFTGDADAVVRIVEGDRARQPPPGVERVAYVAAAGDRPAVAVLVEEPVRSG